jgi:hypothetical protein
VSVRPACSISGFGILTPREFPIRTKCALILHLRTWLQSTHTKASRQVSSGVPGQYSDRLEILAFSSLTRYRPRPC